MDKLSRYPHSGRRATAPWFLPVLLLVALLTGCGGGASTETKPNTQAPEVRDYTGPAPANDDVQAFRVNLWENVRGANRCGACHGVGGQAPQFARSDDVNAAYAEVGPVVNLSSPIDSRLVTKIAGGHHCWLDSDVACASILAVWISNWAGGGSGGEATEIELEAPPERIPGAAKAFPDDPGAFASTVHPLLVQHCASCHVSGARTPQSPFFSESDVVTAYAAAKSKINLDNPAESRLVVRLREESHNCWSDSCEADAQAMEAAIAAFAAPIEVREMDPALVLSRAVRLTDGIVAAGGNRYEGSLIAKYEFKEGAGYIAYDTSGVEPAANLTLSGDVGWVGGWGLDLRGGKAQASTAASRKLARMIKTTGEFSVEAWVVPGNVTQEGPARIISYSAGTGARNFTLGQTQYSYDFLVRSSRTDGNGEPALSTPNAAQVLQATQQHVVLTYTPSAGRRIYVNGRLIEPTDDGGGSLADWDDTYALVLGNEASNDRPWQGKLRFVAIYNRALTPEQITQNMAAGVGERYYLLFRVGHLIGVEDAYLLFEVSQFDDYSYLFHRPTLIALDGGRLSADLPIQGMRLGLNGREVSVGQAFRTLDVTVAADSDLRAGQVLTTQGAVIARERGPEQDEFFLTFERLGDHSNVTLEPVPLAPPPVDLPPSPDVGLRTFEEIHATMATVTGVSPTEPAVAATFDTVRQQLPTVEAIEGFLSAHQMAVAQLAIEYCNALIENPTLRADYFPGVDFNASVTAVFGSPSARDLVLDPLLDRMMGRGLASQPDPAEVKQELNDLIDRLTACGGGCAAGRTKAVAKAVCSATLGSAVTLLQ